MAGPISESSRSKRPLERAEAGPLKRQRSSQAQAISMMWCKILIDGNWLFRDPREILLNTHDYNRFDFRPESADGEKYILIANRLFIPTPSEQVPKGSVCMLPHQLEVIKGGITKDLMGKTTMIGIPPLPSKQFVRAKSTTLKLKPFNEDDLTNKEYANLLVSELDAAFSEILTDKFLIYGQKNVIKLPNGMYVTFKIQKSSYHSDVVTPDLRKRMNYRFIYIDAQTKFDYVTKGNLSLIRQISLPSPEETEIVFKIASIGQALDFQTYQDLSKEKHHRLSHSRFTPKSTPSLSVERVFDAILKFFSGKVVFPGTERLVSFSNLEHNIRLTCNRIDVHGNLTSSSRSQHYKPGVFFYPNCQIKIVPDHTIQLFKDSPLKVKSVSLVVKKVITSISPNPLQPFRDRIDVKELKATILSLCSKVVEGNQFHISLSTGDFLIEVISGKELPTVDQEDNSRSNSSSDSRMERIQRIEESPYVKNLWEITSETKIQFYNSIPEQLELIRNKREIPLRRVVFTISQLEASEEFMQLSERKLFSSIQKISNGVILPKEVFHVNCEGGSFALKVKSFFSAKKIPKSHYSRLGKITSKTKIEIESSSEEKIQIISDTKFLVINDLALLEKELQLGGISEQFGLMIRRTLLPRGKWSSEAQRRGIHPIKGMLLYGPPGTGKTAFATNLGKLFGCSIKNGRLKIITASEIFNKWVGNSEKNVRKLFKNAEKDLKKHGADKAPLHLIIIDELDAAFGERGDRNNNVRDSVVNQLLGKLEESKPPENIMVVGITNRKENIDPALLRKGRLGLHINFGPPSIKAREEIFALLTTKLKEEKLLAKDVDFKILAEKMKGKTGSDIKDLISEASTYSLERISQAESSLSKEERKQLEKVTMEDFMKAFQQTSKSSDSHSNEMYL